MHSKQAKTFGIFVNPRKSRVLSPLDQLDRWIELNKPQARFLLCTYNSLYTRETYNNLELADEEKIINESDVIITLGGDGTILRTVQAIGETGIPILGVNLGGLGFLAETPPNLLLNHVESFLNGHYIIEERTLLQCRINDAHKVFYAMNDLVIDKAGFARVIEIKTKVDGNLLNSYIADAMIISTPTGSTGYSLSAGGPIVIPQTHVFIINPICPHSLTNRPVVVSDVSQITLLVNTEHKEVNLLRDGRQVGNYPSGTTFNISRAHFSIKMVRIKNRGFFETLRNKLNWGDDFRDKNRWSYTNSSH